MAKRICYILLLGFLNPPKVAAQLRLSLPPDTFPIIRSIRVLPQNFYNKTTGFFCQQENQLQKHTHLPVYMRLGSKDHVDYLEQKPNAINTIKN